MAQTGRTVTIGHGRTLEMLIKYGVWYAIIETPNGIEYYGPLEDVNNQGESNGL
jgi:hypothetical protein